MELSTYLKNLNKNKAIEKGKMSKYYFDNEIYYQKWCKFVINELETLK
jgi:hypothetical protein